MRVHRMQEGVAHKATRGSGGVEFGLGAVAVNDIVAGIARIRRVGDTELGVVENVVSFGAKLDIKKISEWLKVLEQ